MILGTAGHVDHGKTALVHALTGVDTDRLPEEKRRGITIELGFAPLQLTDELHLGVVDVPGHEAFVRTMLAGATGIDLALLVIAADEGVMPQTREHLDILRLLGTRNGVVALAKCDLVNEEWLALVEEDVRRTLAGSPLAGAPIVRTSAVRGEGLDALRAELIAASRVVPLRSRGDLFRMPVDRSFIVHGTGTVVTGTVWSGVVDRDARVIVLPTGHRARIRGVESHGARVEQALPATRAALALAGVDAEEIPRGSVIVSDPSWRPSSVLLAEVALLDGAGTALGPRRRVRLHLGTQDVEARIVASGGAIAAGERRQARVVTGEPVVARAGDRFVLRAGSPLTTIGGGVVNDPLPGRARPRPWPRTAASAAERLQILLELEGDRGIASAELAIRTGAPPADVDALLALGEPAAVRVGERVYDVARVARLRGRVLLLVEDHHRTAPLEAGMPLQLLRARLGAPLDLADRLVQELARAGELRVDGAQVARSAFSPRLSPDQEQLAQRLLAALRAQGCEPATTDELERTYGREAGAVLRHLERQGFVACVEPVRFYERSVLDGMIASVRGAMTGRGSTSPAELREVLGVSRKYLIPFLEYCDRAGITERAGEGRVLRKHPDAQRKLAGDLLDT